MPFTQLMLLKVPTVILGIIIIGSAVILSVGGLFIVRLFVPHARLKIHNDVAGPIFATLGVVYAVLLAFIVVITWQNFDRSKTNVQSEANCLMDLYRDSEALSQNFKEAVRPLLREYGAVVINEEWPAMAKGGSSPYIVEIEKRIWKIYGEYLIENKTDFIFLQESVRKLNELGEYRDLRIMDSKTGVHPILWLVLIAGGVATITFTSFFGTENMKAQIIMTVLLSVIIALILFTIFVLDFPFTGDITISPEPFKLISTGW